MTMLGSFAAETGAAINLQFKMTVIFGRFAQRPPNYFCANHARDYGTPLLCCSWDLKLGTLSERKPRPSNSQLSTCFAACVLESLSGACNCLFAGAIRS